MTKQNIIPESSKDIRIDIAEHQVLYEFNSDEEACMFEDWLRTNEAIKSFNEYCKLHKEEYMYGV